MANTELITWNTDFDEIPESPVSIRERKESVAVMITSRTNGVNHVAFAYYKQMSKGKAWYYDETDYPVYAEVVAWSHLPDGYRN